MTTTPVLSSDEARLGITWKGEYGELPDPISYGASDDTIRQWATEAISTGGVPGISADRDVDFSLFVVDRYPAKADRHATIQLRAKVPFGGI